MLAKLLEWLHADVATPIAEKFEELEHRIEALEIKVGLKSAPEPEPSDAAQEG